MHILKASDFFPDGRLPLQILRREPQPPYKEHLHEFHELVLVTGGQGVHQTQREAIHITMGDVFVILPGEVHGYRDLRELNLVNVIFLFDRLPLPLLDLGTLPGYHALFLVEPKLRAQGSCPHLRLRFEQLQYGLDLIDKMEHELLYEEAGYQFRVLALFMELLIWLCRLNVPSYERNLGIFAYSLGEVLGYIERHYNQTISIVQLAKMAKLSRSSLFRAFKQTLKISPMEYIQRVRLHHACRLLRYGNDPIYEVSRIVGFKDSNYFCRIFRRTFGMSPRNYRAMIQQAY